MDGWISWWMNEIFQNHGWILHGWMKHHKIIDFFINDKSEWIMTLGIELLSPLNKISPTYSAHSLINCIELYSIESLKIVLTMMSASHRIVQYLYFLEMYESSFFKHDEFFIEWMDCLKMLHGFINKWMIYLKLMDGFLHGWINLSNYQNLSFEWLVTSHSHSPTSWCCRRDSWRCHITGPRLARASPSAESGAFACEMVPRA